MTTTSATTGASPKGDAPPPEAPAQAPVAAAAAAAAAADSNGGPTSSTGVNSNGGSGTNNSNSNTISNKMKILRAVKKAASERVTVLSGGSGSGSGSHNGGDALRLNREVNDDGEDDDNDNNDSVGGAVAGAGAGSAGLASSSAGLLLAPPKTPKMKNMNKSFPGGGGNLEEAAVGGLTTSTDGGNDGGLTAAVDDGVGSGVASEQQQSQPQQQQGQEQTQRSPSMRELLGSCGTAEALDNLMPGLGGRVRGRSPGSTSGSGGGGGMGGIPTSGSLRMPSRQESVEFVRNLSGSLPPGTLDRLREVRDELNASVLRCVRSDVADRRTGGGGASNVPSCQGVGVVSAAAATATAPSAWGARSSSIDGSIDGPGNGGASVTSFRTLDTREEELEDEMYRLERMTSWRTQETIGTVATYGTAGTAGTYSTAGGGDSGGENTLSMLGLDEKDRPPAAAGALSSNNNSRVIKDDDGNEIPDEVLKDLKARRQRRSRNSNSSRRKKKAVQFDYPPISSLRECPRTDPKDRSGLFFTEEELEQIEDDRTSCKMVDDIEVVAVPALASPANSTANANSNNSKDAGAANKKVSKRQARKLALGASMRKQNNNKEQQPSSSSISVSNTDLTESLSSGSASRQHQRTNSLSQVMLAIPPTRRKRSNKGDGGERPSTPLPDHFSAYNPEDEIDDNDGGRANSNNRVQQKSYSADNSAANVGGMSPSATSSGAESGTPEKKEEKPAGPLLKGVQIYLRQRSTNEKRKGSG